MSFAKRAMSTAMGTVSIAAALLLVTSCSSVGAPGASSATSMAPGMDMSSYSPSPASSSRGAELAIEATEYAFSPAPLKAAAGETTIKLTNKGAMDHDLTIDALNVHLTATAGKTAQATVTLKPGTYQVYCSVAGHRQSGMQGTLTVS